MLFDLKKWRPTFAEKIKLRPFCGCNTKNKFSSSSSEKICGQKGAQKLFGQVWGNGKKSSHPKNLPAPAPVAVTHIALTNKRLKKSKQEAQ